MWGLRSNCELVYAWIGAFAGLTVSFAMPFPPGLSLAGRLWAGAVLGLGAAILVSLVFRVFYRQRFFPLLVSTLFGAVLIGLLVLALAATVTLTSFLMAIMFAVGAIVGQLVGRLLCRACITDRRSPPWAQSPGAAGRG
jgi:hypothetical protein